MIIFAVIQADGAVAGAWRNRDTAEHVCAKGRPGDRVVAFADLSPPSPPVAWDERVLQPALCVDEGCPQHGTAHVCVTP